MTGGTSAAPGRVRAAGERRVLVIDDERRMADSLRDLLVEEGLSVEVAYGGEEGMAAFDRRPFPVVVTDLRMKGASGLDVVRHVTERDPVTQVVVVTGHASTDSAIDALHHRAFDYLRKPFDFAELKRTIDRAFHRVEVDRLREDMAAMITHDVKAPLTTIAGFAALLTDPATGGPHERSAEYADAIRRGCRRALALIDNFLTHHKADTGALRARARRVEAVAFLRDAVEAIRPEAALEGVELRLEADAPAIHAEFDEPLMERAACNLLQNAVKYGDRDEPVTARARVEGEELVLETVNAARGLSAEALEGIFERFARADLHAGIEGSGLGLYVVSAVARAHGGRAEAVVEPPDRARFSIRIPLAAPSKDPPR